MAAGAPVGVHALLVRSRSPEHDRRAMNNPARSVQEKRRLLSEALVRTTVHFLAAVFVLGGLPAFAGCASDSGSGNGGTMSGAAGSIAQSGASGGTGGNSGGSTGTSGEPIDAGFLAPCAMCDKAVACCFAMEAVDAGDCPGYSTAVCETLSVTEQNESSLFCKLVLQLGVEAGVPACL